MKLPQNFQYGNTLSDIHKHHPRITPNLNVTKLWKSTLSPLTLSSTGFEMLQLWTILLKYSEVVLKSTITNFEALLLPSTRRNCGANNNSFLIAPTTPMTFSLAWSNEVITSEKERSNNKWKREVTTSEKEQAEERVEKRGEKVLP